MPALPRAPLRHLPRGIQTRRISENASANLPFLMLMKPFITHFDPACPRERGPLSRVRGVFRMNKPSPIDSVLGLLANAFDRIAAALDRMAPPAGAKPDFAAADAFAW